MWHGTAVGVLVGVPQGRYCLTYVVGVSTLTDDEMGRPCGTRGGRNCIRSFGGGTSRQ